MLFTTGLVAHEHAQHNHVPPQVRPGIMVSSCDEQ
jgi:hypothetical protein